VDNQLGRVVESLPNPLRSDSGDITRWCGVDTDIEDRKRAEQALENDRPVRG
jgi:hypothetical protein